jgi:PHD/YefM family antitoxin component YafN of YafNO toxin-antitoxin module
MKSINILSVSEARKQLPKVIQLVTAGEIVVIVNRRNKKKFQVTLFQEAIEPQSQPRTEPYPF